MHQIPHFLIKLMNDDIIICFVALKKEEELSLPTESDLLSAVLSIERLQNTYNLSASDLMQLKVNGVQYEGIPMVAMDAYEMGRQLYGAGRFGRAVEWLEEAMTGLQQMNFLTNGLYYLAYAYHKTGYAKESAERFKVLAELIELNSNKTEVVERYTKKLKGLRKIRHTYKPQVSKNIH